MSRPFVEEEILIAASYWCGGDRIQAGAPTHGEALLEENLSARNGDRSSLCGKTRGSTGGRRIGRRPRGPCVVIFFYLLMLLMPFMAVGTHATANAPLQLKLSEHVGPYPTTNELLSNDVEDQGRANLCEGERLSKHQRRRRARALGNLQLETTNTTGWTALKERLRVSKAAIICSTFGLVM